MDNIVLEQSENSPKIIMDSHNAFVEFEGKSYPENTPAFYRPITEWLKHYFKLHRDRNKTMIVNFKFTYFNSATTQIIFEILDIIEDAEVKNIEIYWFYDKENKSSFEDYEDYSEEFPELNINAVTY